MINKRVDKEINLLPTRLFKKANFLVNLLTHQLVNLLTCQLINFDYGFLGFLAFFSVSTVTFLNSSFLAITLLRVLCEPSFSVSG